MFKDLLNELFVSLALLKVRVEPIFDLGGRAAWQTFSDLAPFRAELRV